MEKLPKDVFDIIGSCLELGREDDQCINQDYSWTHLESVSPSFADKFYDSLVKARQSCTEYCPVIRNIYMQFLGGYEKGYDGCNFDCAEDLRRRGLLSQAWTDGLLKICSVGATSCVRFESGGMLIRRFMPSAAHTSRLRAY